MKHSQKRTFMDIEKMNSNEFRAFCRSGNQNHFTRTRKMPLQDLLFTMINRKGLTLALELRNYMKIAHPGTFISKPGYLKQRMKLNPDAFLELYKYHNRNFYADSSFSTYKGHLILAADGSDINIPTTAETLELYGSASRKNTKPQFHDMLCICIILVDPFRIDMAYTGISSFCFFLWPNWHGKVKSWSEKPDRLPFITLRFCGWSFRK